MNTPHNLQYLDKRINGHRRLEAGLAAIASGGIIAFGGGLACTFSGYALDNIASDHVSAMPSPAVRPFLAASALTTVGGFGAGLTSSLALGFAATRRRRIQQKKYQLQFRVVQDMMTPSGR